MNANHAHLRVPSDFGAAIQQARIARGLSQNGLAVAVNVPQSTISQLENGKSTIFLRRLLAIARETGIEFNATWESDDAPRG